MLILADENMPHAEQVFSQLGEVRLVPGRSVSPDTVREADMLMVRSVTRVNAALLEGSRVRFVGTATIGMDHIDQPYLASRGIGFASAPGCNAESVAQYVGAALAFAAGRLGRPLSQSSIGIVGVGNCGRRVERVARALGMQVTLNDPPLARETGDVKYRPLHELLDCDFLSLHVPLTKEGPDPTWRLVNDDVLARLNPHAVLINGCRGYVVDEAALAARIDTGQLAGAILDAWEGEPAINPAMLQRALIGTPHIAGYSYDGKVAGTRMVYEAACRFLGREPQPIELPLPEAATTEIKISARHRTFDSVAGELMLTAYPILRDDADLRLALTAADAPPQSIGTSFDRRRKLYPLRREFAATRVSVADAPAEWTAALRSLGFQVE